MSHTNAQNTSTPVVDVSEPSLTPTADASSTEPTITVDASSSEPFSTPTIEVSSIKPSSTTAVDVSSTEETPTVHASSTVPSSTPAIELSSTEPPWLAYIKKRIDEDESQYLDTAHYRIVRDMLLAPDGDDSAVPKAVTNFMNNYTADFATYPIEARKAPEYSAGEELNSITVIVFEVVNYVSFTDINHDRLANLLIGIKTSAASEFNTENPQFVYYGWGLEAEAQDVWNHNHPTGWIVDNEWRTALSVCNQFVNRSALLAKLMKEGMLDSEGPRFLWGDFNKTFETNTHGDVVTNVGRQAQVFASANYVLFAGHVVVKEVKAPSKKWWFELTPAKWKFWASKLEEVANTVGEDAHWGLKTKAQEAHDRMVELYPEAFKEDV
ncbi:hypothetical protein QQZ08_008680 [Neonectria magnoliae]|uniref:Uncharacterized protein n=1 Tax=Neonectria magnoliae TaxID=2732573 RepID=A0ABR1HT91_9HYPO